MLVYEYYFHDKSIDTHYFRLVEGYSPGKEVVIVFGNPSHAPEILKENETFYSTILGVGVRFDRSPVAYFNNPTERILKAVNGRKDVFWRKASDFLEA